MYSKKIIVISIVAGGIFTGLWFVPENEFFGISSYHPESPAPMMILENNSDKIMSGFKITPVSCSITDDGFNESHFQITNINQKDYDVNIKISFTDNYSILYEKEIMIRVLAGQTINQIHLSDKMYNNPTCVVQIQSFSEA